MHAQLNKKMQAPRQAANKLFERTQSEKAQTFSLNLEHVRKLREQAEQTAQKMDLDDELESTYQQQQKKSSFVPKASSITAKRVCDVIAKTQQQAKQVAKHQQDLHDITRRTMFEYESTSGQIKAVIKTKEEMIKLDDTSPIPVPSELIQKIRQICIEFEQDEQDVNVYIRRKRHAQLLAKDQQPRVQLRNDVSIFDDEDVGDYVCEVEDKPKQHDPIEEAQVKQQPVKEENPELVKLRQQVEEAKKKQQELQNKYKSQNVESDTSGYAALYRRGEEVESWLERDKDAVRASIIEEIKAEQQPEEKPKDDTSKQHKKLTWETQSRDKQAQRERKQKEKHNKDKLKRDYGKISDLLKSKHNMDLERPSKKQKRE